MGCTAGVVVDLHGGDANVCKLLAELNLCSDRHYQRFAVNRFGVDECSVPVGEPDANTISRHICPCGSCHLNILQAVEHFVRSSHARLASSAWGCTSQPWSTIVSCSWLKPVPTLWLRRLRLRRFRIVFAFAAVRSDVKRSLFCPLYPSPPQQVS